MVEGGAGAEVFGQAGEEGGEVRGVGVHGQESLWVRLQPVLL